MDIKFPKYLPKIIERCLVIPLITLVLTYSVYVILGGFLLGGVLVLSVSQERSIMDPIILKEGIGVGIVVFIVIVGFVFSFLSKLGKQKTQAKSIEIKMTYGYEPSVDERLDMAKVENVNKIFLYAMIFGIVIASAIGIAVMYFVGMDKFGTDAVFYTFTAIEAFIVYYAVEYAVSAVAQGEWEKCKQSMLEQFRKVDEASTEELSTVVGDLQSQFATLSTALQNISNLVAKK